MGDFNKQIGELLDGVMERGSLIVILRSPISLFPLERQLQSIWTSTFIWGNSNP